MFYVSNISTNYPKPSKSIHGMDSRYKTITEIQPVPGYYPEQFHHDMPSTQRISSHKAYYEMNNNMSSNQLPRRVDITGPPHNTNPMVDNNGNPVVSSPNVINLSPYGDAHFLSRSQSNTHRVNHNTATTHHQQSQFFGQANSSQNTGFDRHDDISTASNTNHYHNDTHGSDSNSNHSNMSNSFAIIQTPHPNHHHFRPLDNGNSSNNMYNHFQQQQQHQPYQYQQQHPQYKQQQQQQQPQYKQQQQQQQPQAYKPSQHHPNSPIDDEFCRLSLDTPQHEQQPMSFHPQHHHQFAEQQNDYYHQPPFGMTDASIDKDHEDKCNRGINNNNNNNNDINNYHEYNYLHTGDNISNCTNNNVTTDDDHDHDDDNSDDETSHQTLLVEDNETMTIDNNSNPTSEPCLTPPPLLITQSLLEPHHMIPRPHLTKQFIRHQFNPDDELVEIKPAPYIPDISPSSTTITQAHTANSNHTSSDQRSARSRRSKITQAGYISRIPNVLTSQIPYESQVKPPLGVDGKPLPPQKAAEFFDKYRRTKHHSHTLPPNLLEIPKHNNIFSSKNLPSFATPTPTPSPRPSDSLSFQSQGQHQQSLGKPSLTKQKDQPKYIATRFFPSLPPAS